MFVAEGCLVVKTSLQTALDVAVTLARVMASAVTMQRASWLQNSGIAPSVQQVTEDLSFDD